MTDRQRRFTEIYQTDYWVTTDCDSDNPSGPGSSLKYTEHLRQELLRVIQELAVGSITDGACGDFNWMKTVLEQAPQVSYLGVDIVEPLIELNRQGYPKYEWQQGDVTEVTWAPTDLLMIRDCLMHLSHADIAKVLTNIRASEAKYVALSSHDTGTSDIVTGGCRMIDLFSKPHHLPHSYLYKIKDYIKGYDSRYLYIWRREDLL